jgi:cell division transport system permease protein
MAAEALKYSLAEGWISLWRRRRSSLISIATIAGSAAVVAAFLVVGANIERLVAGWSTTSEMAIYLKEGASDADRTAVERALARSPLVEARDAVSKPEALARFTREFAELAAVATSLPDNPFPASFDVRLRNDAGEAADALVAELEGLAGVAEVRYDRRFLARLADLLAVARRVALTLGVILIIGATLTVSNVVRLTGYARRTELHIMELVGAPLAFVRGPFIVEGALQGGFGAAAGLGLVAVAFAATDARYGAWVADLLGVADLTFVPLTRCLVLLGGGVVAGGLGGLVAAYATESVVSQEVFHEPGEDHPLMH